MKIKTKIILTVLLVSISFLIIVTYITYLTTKKYITDSVLNNLNSIASIQKSRIIDNINNYFEKIYLVKNRVAIKDNLKNYYLTTETKYRENLFKTLFLSIYPNGAFKNILILDPNGKIITSTDRKIINKDFSKNMAFVDGLNKDSINNFFLDSNNIPSVYLSSPIKDNDKLLGVVLIECYSEKILSVAYDHTGLGDTGEITTGKRMSNGDVVAISPLKYKSDAFLNLIIPKNAIHRPIIQALRGNETIFPNLINYRGKRILSATRYIKSVDWGLTVNIDQEEVFLPIYKLEKMIILLLLITTFLLIIISIYLSEQITKPFKELTKTVYRISEGDLTQRVVVNSNDEIGYMAKAFNKMTENLEKMFNQSTQLNKSLSEEIIHRKEIEAELGKFAYISSHDLQEPLRTITSYVELLEKRYKDKFDDTGLSYIKSVIQSSRRMKDLINDLLTYSRLGNEQADFKEIDLNNILKHVTETLKASIEEKQVEIIYKNLPLITANYILMIQLFQNLISNGIKYNNSDKPFVKLEFEEKPDEWLFKISDNGIGIDNKYFEKIFIIFQRLHNRTEYSGTGIGLTICKKIIDIHNGRIWLESEVDKGSCFYFTIRKPLII